jgi:hypothetical protein
MTYNFDPDKWHADELFMIQARLKKGEIDPKTYDRAVAHLDQRLVHMWERLDGTYQVRSD